MSQIIAGLYELGAEIGAGGGGVVYLGRHIRLDKAVVLKADRRSLMVPADVLRREMDMLKKLSHTYIPQVYDFVPEGGVVYTVLDYIQGESFDRVLDRGEKLPQAKIIQWACQLLEALKYLHGRLPHGILHGDIKPANVMLRLDGNICLIDFNIALNLGEDGAVKVGFSHGYASPEHYGIEYASERGRALQRARRRADRKRRPAGDSMTVSLQAGMSPSVKTVSLRANADKHLSTQKLTGEILLDVRSDIYSLGATLYHMICGHRPSLDAKQVEPLSDQDCSPAVAAIIAKAMSPSPADRYQTAEEMLAAFRQLHRTDPRMVQHKRRIALSAATLSVVFLLGGATAFAGQRQLGQVQEALALSGYSAEALARGDVSEAVRLALQAIPAEECFLDAPVTAETRKALTDALGVYDLSDGFKALDSIELPSAPFDLVVSPEGTRFAAVYAYEAAVYDLGSMEKLAVLPIQESAYSGCAFLDENRIIYAGARGLAAYDLGSQETLWTGKAGATLAVSADGKRVAVTDRKDSGVTVYRTEDGGEVHSMEFGGKRMTAPVNDTFANPKDDIFALNQDGSILAASFSDGGLALFDVENPEYTLTIYEASEYSRFQGGFHGQYFVFAAGGSGNSVFGLVDVSGESEPVFSDSRKELLLQAGERGIYLAEGDLLVSLEPASGNQMELARTADGEITAFSVGEKYVLAAADDGSFSFYDGGANLSSKVGDGGGCDFVVMAGEYAIVGSRNGPDLRLLKLESHREAQLLAYDARYQHSEARVSQDGLNVMFFDYEGFRIYDMAGNMVVEQTLPDAASIYDQQFRKGGTGSWLEVVWYDGNRRCYSAADGSLLEEEKGEKPDKDLYEEFFTDKYRIVSGLHDAPEAYDRETDKLVAVLEQDSYLTYVTQMGEYVITEYISTSGERYGILLDDKLQKIAILPELCDVSGERLVFDYGSGDLRQSKVYSLEELAGMGEAFLRGGDEGEK